MAAKSTKSKKNDTIANTYLKVYNLTLAFGWTYVLYKFLTNDFSSTVEANLWHTVKVPLLLSQNAAILEIIHACAGLVSSNPMVTLVQVFSRLWVVNCILLAVPLNYAPSSFGLPLCLTAWGITEIIRYSYYFTNLIGYVPYFLQWCRYTFFIALYPIGITGELLCQYSAMQYAISNPNVWSFTLPNNWNFTFSYHYTILIIMLTYIPLFPQLYLHMFGQRRKVLKTGGDSAKKAQ